MMEWLLASPWDDLSDPALLLPPERPEGLSWTMDSCVCCACCPSPSLSRDKPCTMSLNDLQKPRAVPPVSRCSPCSLQGWRSTVDGCPLCRLALLAVSCSMQPEPGAL